MKLMLTIGGLMNCNVPEFKPQEYKGLRQNCGRKSKHDKDVSVVVDKRERRSKPNRMSDIERAVEKVMAIKA